MFSKVAVFVTVFAVVFAGQEPPPPKVHTYNVNQVAKVQYPGPQVAKQVETYSAPSIEKTTTITRTITAPLNAPQGRTVAYASPSPVIKAAAPAVLAVPQQFAYAAPGYAHGPAAYAAPAYAAAPVAYAGLGAVSAPGLAYQAPIGAGYAGHGQQFQTVYSSPSLGYSLGGAQFLAAAPAAYAAPAYAAPAYAAAAPAAVVKSGY